MVKGISRQVIVVHGGGDGLFDQAIFILKDGVRGVSDEMLLKQAHQAIRSGNPGKVRFWRYGCVWACGGAALTGLVWLLTGVL